MGIKTPVRGAGTFCTLTAAFLSSASAHAREKISGNTESINLFFALLQPLRNFINEPFRFLPSETGVSNGFAIFVFVDFLAARQ